MKGRVGLFLGLGAGYVLGAKAGHQRYDQMVRLYDNVLASPRVQKATYKAKETMETGIGQAGAAAAEGRTRVTSAAAEGRAKVTSAVRERRSGNSSGNLAVAPPPSA